MSEEDDPLGRDGNWHRLSISFDDPREMEQMGPNLEVNIAAVTEQAMTLARHSVGALIDTGSWSSCISPRLASKMDGGRGESAAYRPFMASLKVRRRSEA
jgi:hypothetical protein